jgi:hypothetical protein
MTNGPTEPSLPVARRPSVRTRLVPSAYLIYLRIVARVDKSSSTVRDTSVEQVKHRSMRASHMKRTGDLVSCAPRSHRTGDVRAVTDRSIDRSRIPRAGPRQMYAYSIRSNVLRTNWGLCRAADAFVRAIVASSRDSEYEQRPRDGQRTGSDATAKFQRPVRSLAACHVIARPFFFFRLLPVVVGTAHPRRCENHF